MQFTLGNTEKGKVEGVIMVTTAAFTYLRVTGKRLLNLAEQLLATSV